MEYIFREVTNQQELVEVLKLRYKGYRNSRLTTFCSENEFGIDLDEYDKCAYHFGIFHRLGSTEKAIGYMRLIQEKETPVAKLVQKIATNCSQQILDKVNQTKYSHLPAMNYHLEIKTNIEHHVKESSNQPFKLCEGSRFVFLAEYRSKGLAKFMLDCIMTMTFYQLKFNNAIIGCSVNHRRFYKLYGFKELIDATGLEIKAIPATLMMLQKENIPERFKKQFQKYHEYYSITKEIKFDISSSTEKELKNKALNHSKAA